MFVLGGALLSAKCAAAAVYQLHIILLIYTGVWKIDMKRETLVDITVSGEAWIYRPYALNLPPDSLKLPSGFYNEGCAPINDLLWR